MSLPILGWTLFRGVSQPMFIWLLHRDAVVECPSVVSMAVTGLTGADSASGRLPGYRSLRYMRMVMGEVTSTLLLLRRPVTGANCHR
jgi:hypothetical protein